jgi:hypothetical protein
LHEELLEKDRELKRDKEKSEHAITLVRQEMKKEREEKNRAIANLLDRVEGTKHAL